MSELAENNTSSSLPEIGPDKAALPRVYSVGEVAKAFGRSTRTIRWWEQTGRLKTFPIERSKYVTEAEIQRLIASGEG